MHFLLMLLIVATVIFALISLNSSRSSGGAPANHAHLPEYRGTPPGLSFLANGKLFRKDPGNPGAQEVTSQFVQAIEDRQARSEELNAWKEGTSFAISMSGAQRGKGTRSLTFSSATYRDPGRLLYALQDASAGGLFELDLSTGTEKRLLHRQRLNIDGLRLHSDPGFLLCSQRAPNGIANVSMLNLETLELRELTRGETSDLWPCAVPGARNSLVFQSSGIARGPHGQAMAFGPSSIQLLDVDRGELTTVLEDPELDFLQPRVAPTGELIYLQRPYEGQQYSTGNAVTDLLFMPFRLLRAVFHYLNFFSLMYSRKPLTSASGPQFDQDAKSIIVQGKRLEAEAALKRGTQMFGVPALAPASWQLFERDQQGRTRLLAKHVVAFDVAKDGTILYSNGFGVFALRSGYRPELVLKDHLIGDVQIRPE